MFTNVQELLDSITPEVYKQLKQAVEIGKWGNGEPLSKDQRHLCMQAMIAYEEKHLAVEARTAYIPPREHTHCGSKQGNIADDEKQPLNFKE